jgi:hypothetical protein
MMAPIDRLKCTEAPSPELACYRRRYVRSWWFMSYGDAMQQVNIYQFYRFGQAMQALNALSKDSSFFGEFGTLYEAKSALEDLLEQKHLPMGGIKVAIEALMSSIDLILKVAETESNLDENSKIPTKRLIKMKNDFRRFDIVFEAEIVDRGAKAYSVANKGIFDTGLLVENAEAVIPEELRDLLPDIARSDLGESGRCLAFEIPTAAGFHVLRATEAAIKLYYRSLTGNDWDSTHRESQRNWGKYIEGLVSSGGKNTITDSLTHIKELYRNPIVHPESSLTNHDALLLFSLCSSVITLMLQEVKGRGVGTP